MASFSSAGLLFLCIYVLCLCFENVHAFDPPEPHIPHHGPAHSTMKEYGDSQDDGESQSETDWDPVHFFPPLDYVPHPV